MKLLEKDRPECLPWCRRWRFEMSDEATARKALACLDLTSLTDGHETHGGEADIEALCAKADGKHGQVCGPHSPNTTGGSARFGKICGHFLACYGNTRVPPLIWPRGMFDAAQA